MASENNITSTATSAPSNPAVSGALSTVLGQFNDVAKAGPSHPFTQPMSVPPSSATRSGWASALTAANNPAYKTGIAGAMSNANNLVANGRNPGIYEQTMGGTARGEGIGVDDPTFNRDLARTLDTAGAGVNASIGAGGRYGSGLHVDQLGRTLAGVSDSALLGQRERGLDRQQQALAGVSGERQQGINNTITAGNQLPGLFQASLAPAGVISGVGADQDASALAQRLASKQHYEDASNNNLDWLAKLTSILGGAAPVGGTTATQTQPQAPWWQQALGAAAVGSGIYGNLTR